MLHVKNETFNLFSTIFFSTKGLRGNITYWWRKKNFILDHRRKVVVDAGLLNNLIMKYRVTKIQSSWNFKETLKQLSP
jgi:hypothetical protein